MTNEAPLPDDVERCLSEMPNVGGFGEEWSGTIRAHIAAQSEKISALEKKLSEQIREDEMRLINHCVKIVGNNSKAHIHAEAEFLTRIAELEAENKRLREGLEELARLGCQTVNTGTVSGTKLQKPPSRRR